MLKTALGVAGARPADDQLRPLPGVRGDSAEVLGAGGEDRRAFAGHRHARAAQARFHAGGLCTAGERRGSRDVPRERHHRLSQLHWPRRADGSARTRWSFWPRGRVMPAATRSCIRSSGRATRPRPGEGARQDRGDHGHAECRAFPRTQGREAASTSSGQRCSQLTYNSQNLIGSGSTDRIDGGVSDFGVEIIKAMNEVGMLIDVSHCGDRNHARCDRAVAQAHRDHAFELPRARTIIRG